MGKLPTKFTVRERKRGKFCARDSARRLSRRVTSYSDFPVDLDFLRGPYHMFMTSIQSLTYYGTGQMTVQFIPANHSITNVLSPIYVGRYQKYEFCLSNDMPRKDGALKVGFWTCLKWLYAVIMKQGRIQPGGHRGTCPPPAVTPSMGIYILFYNALITF